MEHSWGYGTERRLRDDNQDCHGVFELPDFTLAVVCDGMGGHVGGAQASTLAVRTLYDLLAAGIEGNPAEVLEDAINRTNVTIYEAARKNHRLTGMGTTLVCALVMGDQALVAHVGDSRAYLVRGQTVTQLTRDHTMVNLFVDAELLSPEDAATHPEAHVLSRSIGVERQVDVELSDVIQLEPGDVLFLCSDGVHGVITDWELANLDWRAPHAAVRQVLDFVETREGDDNATAVAVVLGASVEEVPATPPPEPKPLETSGPVAGAHTVVPYDDEAATEDGQYDSSSPAGAPGYVAYEDHPIREEDDQEPVTAGGPAPIEVAPPQPPAPPAPVVAAPAPLAAPPPPAPPAKPAVVTPPKAPPSTRRRLMAILPVALALAALLFAVGVVALLLMPDGEAVVDAGGKEPVKALTGSNPVAEPPPKGPEPGKAPDPKAPDPAAPADPLACDPEAAVFAPKLPPPPRRLPWRPTECTQPPPGGPEQFRAVDAARRHDCRESLQAVQAGMKKSIDHCRLYQTAWLCFAESHERPLEGANAKEYADLKYELHHLEGTPEQAAQYLSEEQKRLPTWAQPATDGLEFRLQAWNEDPQMGHFVTDLFGEPRVADDFAKDLHLEALMAAGLACRPVEERTPQMIDEWARRVYVVTRTLERDRTGRLLAQHRADLVPVLRGLLQKAIAETPENPLPEPVKEAWEVGMGTKPEPTGQPKPVGPRPDAIKEPEIPADEGGIEVNRPR